MENEQLRTAITRAGLTLEEFADIVQVDVKTVQRWLAGRTAPYPRNRARVAGALDTTEHALWPNAVAPPTESPERGQPMPVVTDVVAGYAHASDRDAPHTVDVLRAAAERIELIIPNVIAGFVDLLLTKAAEGCHVRAIIEDADGQVEPLLEIDGIEIHASRGENYGLHRADDQILLLLHRIGVHSEPSPLIHIQRRTSVGLFDRLADEYDERWEQTTPLPTRERLHAYLAEVELERAPEPDIEPDPRRHSHRRRRPSRPAAGQDDGPDPCRPGAHQEGARCHEVGAIVARAAGPSRSGPSRLLGLPTARGPSLDCPTVTRSAPPKS